MIHTVVSNTIKRVICNESRTFCTLRKAWAYRIEQSNAIDCRENQLLKFPKPTLRSLTRFKHENKKQSKVAAQEEDESSSSSEDESSDDETSSDEEQDEVEDMSKFEDIPVYMATKDTSYRTAIVPTRRLDVVAKTLFNTSRKSIELEFYNSKVRVNGQAQPKKSVIINEGDEIDLIIGADFQNPEMIRVRRAYIAGIQTVKKGVEVNAAVQKNLLIENYKSPWKPVE